ncbi:MutS-related protein [Spirosoma sordidisoli]|uniref:DNA mismatch repair protein MutS n=1 Tax=Spirosoma sordidisoli TaxID=2502893 RepID=A0A4Q2UDL9_9BACT|nr:DNA mismatch repair protein MutS [Spirosoma sordidisoli]RYC66936.1 DNA mismatch repair protein MutS [Spirosoma sordidisoli]
MPRNTFSKRQQDFIQVQQAAQRQYNQLAIGRLIWFISAVVAVWVLARADQSAAAVVVLVVGLAGFLVLLKRHQAVRRDRDLARKKAFINQDELARLDRQYLRTDTGDTFAHTTHPYTHDLDIFGKHSLFRLLNRTHTYEGRQKLAAWLQTPAPADVIRLRQQATADLRPEIDWRQQVEALADLEETIGRSPESLIQWGAGKGPSLPGYLAIIRFLLPAITAAVFVAWLLGYLPGLAVLAALAVHSLVLSQLSAQAKEVSEQTFALSVALRSFQQLFAQAEQAPGQSVRIAAVRQALNTNGNRASQAIGQLARLTEGLNFRRNPYFYLLFGVASLWDIHYLFRLSAWQAQYGPHLGRWFEALGELEALNSLAGFAYAHPAYTTPDIADGAATLRLTRAAHPLLPPDRSVPNSLALAGSGKTVLITGSNMSGKSTFLRTVGANVVLALAGAVVSADSFTVSVVRVFTSMRTQDSLEESTSSFYAELIRLQTLIRLTQQSSGTPVLYFLDEILKGTNSADRHRGAEALIRQLHRTSAFGFVSTHDLELGQLTDAAGFVSNYHFQSDIQDGKLIFDYTLRDGICESFNASQLMQAIGIEMNAALGTASNKP